MFLKMSQYRGKETHQAAHMTQNTRDKREMENKFRIADRELR